MTTNRYFILFLLTLASFGASAQSTKEAVVGGLEKCERMIEAHQWHEAFVQVRAVDASIGGGKPELHYLVAKQRYRMYQRLNKNTEARENLQRMEALAKASGEQEIVEDMLLVKAYFNNRTGNPQVARECYRQILDGRAKGKDEAGMDQCFKDMIAEAKSKQNTGMSAYLTQRYTAWQDSLAAVRAAEELKQLQSDYAAAQEDIAAGETKIQVQWGTIIFLGLLSMVLAAALVFCVMVLLRHVRTIKKLRNSLNLSNQSNEQKSGFMRNISAQISPSLEQIALGNTTLHIEALRQMLAHAEHYMTLESEREVRYELKDTNVGKLCQDLAINTTTGLIPLMNEAPSISFPINSEAVTTLLHAIICEAVNTPGTESITLGFKKRNPHTGQFVVTIPGMMVDEADRALLFTPFAKVYDLTVTDGLLLPTCALMAYKMGGQLTLDAQYKKGTRFILEVQS